MVCNVSLYSLFLDFPSFHTCKSIVHIWHNTSRRKLARRKRLRLSNEMLNERVRSVGFGEPSRH